MIETCTALVFSKIFHEIELYVQKYLVFFLHLFLAVRIFYIVYSFVVVSLTHRTILSPILSLLVGGFSPTSSLALVLFYEAIKYLYTRCIELWMGCWKLVMLPIAVYNRA